MIITHSKAESMTISKTIDEHNIANLFDKRPEH